MSASSRIAPKLTKYLTTPWKIASGLDWRKRRGGSILTLQIERDAIGLAVASHPSNQFAASRDDDNDDHHLISTTTKLNPIPINFVDTSSDNKRRQVIAPDLLETLYTTVQTHNVCGVVVNWPLQKEGRCGASCGRVLHLLDGIVAAEGSILSTNRRFCLWDSRHIKLMKEDEWGRSPVYGQQTLPQPLPTNDSESEVEYGYYYSSHQEERETIDGCSSDRAVDTWNDFFRIYWPEMYWHQLQQQKHPEGSDYPNNHFILKDTCSNPFKDSGDYSSRHNERLLDDDNYEDTTSYTKMAAF